MKSRLLRSLPGACLFAALLLFAAFHVSRPVTDDDELGWRIWENIWDYTKTPETLVENPADGVALASFLAFTLLLVASPFLLPVLRKSRGAWWALMIVSGLAGVGFWIAIFHDGIGDTEIGMGIWFLLFANTLNFVGLATARAGIRSEGFPLHGKSGAGE